jgi:hypothetical protein
MDVETMLQMGGVSTTSMAIVLVVYRILKSLRGKKLVSSCCGNRVDVGFDVESMRHIETHAKPEEKKPESNA